MFLKIGSSGLFSETQTVPIYIKQKAKRLGLSLNRALCVILLVLFVQFTHVALKVFWRRWHESELHQITRSVFVRVVIS